MLSDSELLAKNIDRWKLFYPIEASKLKALHARNIQFHQNHDNSLNLKIIDLGCCIHAHENPLDEAKQWFESLDLNGIKALVILGVGLGYFYDAAKDWLHGNSIHQIVFLEPDLEIIYHLFQTEQGSKILNDPQVTLAPVDLNGRADIALSIFCSQAYRFTALPIYEKHIPAFVEICKSNAAFILKLKSDSILEFVDHGYIFCSNYYRNLLSLPKAYTGDALVGKFQDIPAIICGAGPSLSQSAAFVEASKNKALIFGGGTAMNGLNAYGVLPHFGVGIDPNIAQFTRLIMNQAYEVPYFYRNRMSSKAVEFIHGPHLYLSGSTGYDIGPYFEQKFGLPANAIQEGYNVINFSLSIALALGCNPIILVGVDLAYTNGLSYCPGILNHPLHERKDFFGTKTATDELIQKTDIYGNPVLTLWKWIAESLWFSNIAKENPSIKLYNATQGGVGFPGIPNISHDHASQHLLKRSYDLEGKIHAAIMQANLPVNVNKAAILDALKDLLQSLQKSQKLVESLYKSLSETIYRYELKSSMQSAELSDYILETQRHLEEEPAYKALLQNFGKEYESIYQQEYRKIHLQDPLLAENDGAMKKTKLEVGKLVFLMETIRTHVDLIEVVLAEDADREVSSKLTTAKAIASKVELSDAHEIYAYDNGLLELQDALLNLQHRETFIPDPDRGVECIYYEQGSVQHIHYLKENQLHGPSIFYTEDGKVLAKHWFLDGKLQGKGEGYYSDGVLAHLTRYRDNRLEGSQYYFYPSGLLKSILNYKNGLPHGDIKLYFPSGSLFRQLHMENGKRKGYDRIWNEGGTLVIEAEFDADLPVGVAKEWHPSGALAKEVIFSPDSPLYQVHFWDEQGAPIAHSDQMHDFFDKVAEHSQILTSTLQEAVDRVEKALPGLKQIESEADSHKLGEQLVLLQEQLKLLDKISHQMLFESGLDTSNPQEAIWKTPNLRREIEQEILKMDEAMQQEIKILKHSLDKNIKKNNPSTPSSN